jgi:hypothetical protein
MGAGLAVLLGAVIAYHLAQPQQGLEVGGWITREFRDVRRGGGGDRRIGIDLPGQRSRSSLASGASWRPRTPAPSGRLQARGLPPANIPRSAEALGRQLCRQETEVVPASVAVDAVAISLTLVAAQTVAATDQGHGAGTHRAAPLLGTQANPRATRALHAAALGGAVAGCHTGNVAATERAARGIRQSASRQSAVVWHSLWHCRSPAQRSGCGQVEVDRQLPSSAIWQTPVLSGPLTQRPPTGQSLLWRQASWQRPKLQASGPLHPAPRSQIAPALGLPPPHPASRIGDASASRAIDHLRG